MNNEEVKDRLAEIARKHSDDPEIAHGLADDAIAEFLRTNGYADVVDAMYRLTKSCAWWGSA